VIAQPSWKLAIGCSDRNSSTSRDRIWCATSEGYSRSLMMTPAMPSLRP
jgi:hypothetical protein